MKEISARRVELSEDLSDREKESIIYFLAAPRANFSSKTLILSQ
jgi:hypothetical protein